MRASEVRNALRIVNEKQHVRLNYQSTNGGWIVLQPNMDVSSFKPVGWHALRPAFSPREAQGLDTTASATGRWPLNASGRPSHLQARDWSPLPMHGAVSSAATDPRKRASRPSEATTHL